MRKQESITKEIAKIEARIARLSGLLVKKEAVLSKLGIHTEADWRSYKEEHDGDNSKEFNTVLWAWINRSIVVDDLNYAERQLERAERELDEVLKVEAAKEALNESKIPEIEAYLDYWLAKAIKYYKAHNLLVETYAGDPATATEKDLIDERNRKSDVITRRILSKVGKVSRTSGLEIGLDGNINGFVRGEKGSVEIRSVLAGGWNIQRLHSRLLFIEI